MGETPQNLEAEKSGKIHKLGNVFKKLVNEIQAGVHNEFIWPIFSLIATLKPVHSWVTGHRAKIEKGDKVLEVGGGMPFYKVYSGRVGKEGVFVSLDINPNIQKRSRKICYLLDRILRQQKDNNVMVADAGKLPFEESTFDIVIANNFTGGKEYIGEAFRVLKLGGRLLSAFLEPLYPVIGKGNAKDCKAAGFTDVKIRPGLPGLLGFVVASAVIPGSNYGNTLITFGGGWSWDVVAKKPESLVPDLNSQVSISGV